MFSCNHTDGCNYWYDQVPKSSNQTNCTTRTGDSITLTCAVYHPFENISIEWYRSDTEGGDIGSSGERITNSAGGKYLLVTANTNARANNETRFINCCFTSFLLGISQFTQNETGYYWCQIVTPNRCLQNSPYAFISLHHETLDDPQTCRVANYINHLNPPICASDRTYLSPTERRTCNSSYSTDTEASTTTTASTPDSIDQNFTSATATNHTTSHVTTTSNARATTLTPITNSQSVPWTNILLLAVIIVLLVLTLCITVKCCKYRALLKRGKSALLTTYIIAILVNLSSMCITAIKVNTRDSEGHQYAVGLSLVKTGKSSTLESLQKADMSENDEETEPYYAQVQPIMDKHSHTVEQPYASVNDSSVPFNSEGAQTVDHGKHTQDDTNFSLLIVHGSQGNCRSEEVLEQGGELMLCLFLLQIQGRLPLLSHSCTSLQLN